MEENKLLKGMFYIGAFVFVLLVCWYVLAEPDVRDQRNAADDVRGALERADGEQQRAIETAQRIDAGLERSVVIIDRIEEGTGNAAGAVDRAASGNEAARRIVEDSQRRVETCQRILQEVRGSAR